MVPSWLDSAGHFSPVFHAFVIRAVTKDWLGWTVSPGGGLDGGWLFHSHVQLAPCGLAGLLLSTVLRVVRLLTWWLTYSRASVPRDQGRKAASFLPHSLGYTGPDQMEWRGYSIRACIPESMATEGSSLESSYHSQIGSTKQGLREKRKTMWRSYPEQRQFSWPFRLRILPSSLVGQSWKLQLKSINSICSCTYLCLRYWIQFSFHIMSSVTVNKSFSLCTQSSKLKNYLRYGYT